MIYRRLQTGCQQPSGVRRPVPSPVRCFMTTLSPSDRLRLISISILALTTPGLHTLSAQQPTNNVAAGWLDRATLSGDWNGVRTSMENRGISFSAHFGTASAMNPVGGVRPTARYKRQKAFGF